MNFFDIFFSEINLSPASFLKTVLVVKSNISARFGFLVFWPYSKKLPTANGWFLYFDKGVNIWSHSHSGSFVSIALESCLPSPSVNIKLKWNDWRKVFWVLDGWKNCYQDKKYRINSLDVQPSKMKQVIWDTFDIFDIRRVLKQRNRAKPFLFHHWL